jgi:hypothetical protein
MANGYGPIKRRTNARGQLAPPGFHYMPDGSLMSDVEHDRLYGQDFMLHSFYMDYSDVEQAGEIRKFTITGTKGAKFSLEIKSGSNYYNFTTKRFQATKSRLDKIELSSTTYKGSITLPTVSADAQYDIFFWAELGTKHASYSEVRFADDSIDINSSTGSSSLLVKKVIYQYTDVTLTISPFAVTSMEGTVTSAALTIPRGNKSFRTPFKTTIVTANATSAYEIIKQPDIDDVIAFVTVTTGDPVILPKENIYPTARDAFTGDDVNGAVTSGAVVRMDNTDLSAVIAVGDKVTASIVTSTVDGAIGGSGETSNRIVIDHNVADKMAVGDEVICTHKSFEKSSDAIVEVTHLNPDSDNTKEFQVSQMIAVNDGVELSFSPKVNRSLTTVTVVETSGTATDFTMSQAIQFRDNQPLTFTPQKNYRWIVDNNVGITPGMITLQSSVSTANSVISEYKVADTLYENTELEEEIISFKAPFKSDTAKPTVTKGKIVTQAGTITFDKQQVLALTDTSLKIGGYGEDHIFNVSGYKVKFHNLKITLTPKTTTTTSSTVGSSSTSVAVASRGGVLNGNTVSGIGIDSSSGLPTISSGATSQNTAGTIVLSAAQELESGVTLTFGGSSRTATITGDIEVIKPGNQDYTLRIDFSKLLSVTA